MKKTHLSIRIEKKIKRWLEDTYGSISEGAIKVLQEKYDHYENPHAVISRIEQTIKGLRKRENQAYNQIKIELTEGNMQSRKRAEEALKLKEKKDKRKKEELQGALSRIKKTKLWSEFEKDVSSDGWDHDKLMGWDKKLAKEFREERGFPFTQLTEVVELLRSKTPSPSPTPTPPSQEKKEEK